MKSWGVLVALALAAVPHPTPAADDRAPGTCLTAPEEELVRLLNEFRTANGRPALRVSKSLSLVARWHAIDLSENQSAQGTDPSGLPCDLHSWSDQGPWTPLCYTADHRYAEAMWRKPRELTANVYLGNGFEAVYWTGGPLVVPRAIEYWTDRREVRDMILAEGAWRGADWPAMGVGLVGEYAVLWFGDQTDRQGNIAPCARQSPPMTLRRGRPSVVADPSTARQE